MRANRECFLLNDRFEKYFWKFLSFKLLLKAFEKLLEDFWIKTLRFLVWDAFQSPLFWFGKLSWIVNENVERQLKCNIACDFSKLSKLTYKKFLVNKFERRSFVITFLQQALRVKTACSKPNMCSILFPLLFAVFSKRKEAHAKIETWREWKTLFQTLSLFPLKI